MLALCLLARPAAPAVAWLRGPAFDLVWLLGLPVWAVVAVLSAWPALGPWAGPLYAGLSGLPHLAASYSRVYYTAADRRRWWAVAFLLPPAILLGILLTLLVGGERGLAAVTLLYLSWLLWHYARQAWGLARQYQRRAGVTDPSAVWTLRLAMHVPPVVAALWFLARLPDHFLTFPILAVPLPTEVLAPALFVAPLALGPLLVQAARSGSLARPDVLMALQSTGIFYATLVGLADVDAAFLALSIWHTLQYQAFVWLAETRRVATSSAGGLLGWLFVPGRPWRYLAWLVVLAWLLFAAPAFVVGQLGWPVVASTIGAVALFTANLHHFLLDTWLWASPRAAPRPE